VGLFKPYLPHCHSAVTYEIFSFIAGVARHEVGLKYRALMAQFNTLSAFAAALRTADPPPPVPRPPTVGFKLDCF
jgi:hypothetical protein